MRASVLFLRNLLRWHHSHSRINNAEQLQGFAAAEETGKERQRQRRQSQKELCANERCSKQIYNAQRC